jgi:hypothetical protein
MLLLPSRSGLSDERRWRPWLGICAGRSRSGCRSITGAGTRTPGTGIGPGCCCTAGSVWRLRTARAWRRSRGCSTPRPSRSSLRRRRQGGDGAEAPATAGAQTRSAAWRRPAGSPRRPNRPYPRGFRKLVNPWLTFFRNPLTGGSRRAADRRPPRARHPGHGRAPTPQAAPDRAASWRARSPLGTRTALHRRRQSAVKSSPGRGPRQPQPTSHRLTGKRPNKSRTQATVDLFTTEFP